MNRFFTSLRFVQNDSRLSGLVGFGWGGGGGGGGGAARPHNPPHP
jgi:hypothetical protein